MGVLPKLWEVHSRVCILWYYAKCRKSSVLADARILWHQKVPQKSSLQAMVYLVSVESSAFIFLVSPWLCSRNHQGNKSVGCPYSSEADHGAEKDHAAIRETFGHPCGISPLDWKETFWERGLAALLTPRGTRGRASTGNKIKGLLKLILGLIISPAHHCASWFARDG